MDIDETPNPARQICAGVDVLADRLEVVIREYDPHADASAFEYHVVITSDPAQAPAWQALWLLLQAPVVHPTAGLVHIGAVGIDSGGCLTQQVYRFVAEHSQLNADRMLSLFAIKTFSSRAAVDANKSVLQDVCIDGKVVKNAVRVYFVAVKNDLAASDAARCANAAYALIRQPGSGLG
jgi:phage terminase large subunit GpA-like protein